MTCQHPAHAVRVIPTPPTPIPSPPLFEKEFESSVESHHRLFRTATFSGHSINATCSSSSSPSRDWAVRFHAHWITGQDCRPYTAEDIPTHFLPFFTYKDVAVYEPWGAGHPLPDPFNFFDVLYREWYPTRDRSVFDQGILRGAGAPFFSTTFRVQFEDKTVPEGPILIQLLVRWHVALARHVRKLVPNFSFLKEDSPRILVRPGLESDQVPPPGRFVRHVDYAPVLRRTFTDCFIWVEGGFEENGVRLVVLWEEMLHRMLFSECEGLTRDVELEEAAKEAARVMAEGSGPESKESSSDGDFDIDDVKALGHVRIWRGSLKDVMRAVLAGDELRKTGLREYNTELEEWLGEGVNVGKDTLPQNE